MLSLICPSGGSYWNRKPFWWISQSWLLTGLTRAWMILRLALYIVGFLVDLFTTAVFGVLFPVMQLLVNFFGSFFSFMFGLLLLELNIEWGYFVPIMGMFVAWIFWALYPFIGCWIQDNLVPIWRNMLPFILQLLVLGLTLINVLLQIWDAFVPLIGMLLAVMIELVIIFFKILVQLMGDGALFKLFGLIQQIIVTIVQITIELLQAVVAMSPSIVAMCVNVLGYCLTIFIESVPFLIQIFAWTFRVLYFVLEPILDLLVSIAKMFRGGTVSPVRSARSMPMPDPSGGWAKDPDKIYVDNEEAQQTQFAPDYDPEAQEFNEFHQNNENIQYSASSGLPVFVDYTARSFDQYYTQDSAVDSSAELNEMNDYHIRNPLGMWSSYFYLNQGTLAELPALQVEEEEFMTAEMLSLHRGDFEYSHDTADDDYDQDQDYAAEDQDAEGADQWADDSSRRRSDRPNAARFGFDFDFSRHF
jgi:hypothetical protein